MSSKFFNNNQGNTLFDKFKALADNNREAFKRFLAAVGYFRSTGYFRLHPVLHGVEEIRILVGINVDEIFNHANNIISRLIDPHNPKEFHEQAFLQDIKTSPYSPQIEEGITQMCNDMHTGRLQMRIHPKRNLHAKFYLCLPRQYNEHTPGWVITGSSNLSESGLGLTKENRYELNVEMRDYDDVEFCRQEFEQLWAESEEITANDVDELIKKTYLRANPTPYEIYMKVLIDTFGKQVEDTLEFDPPKGYRRLKYQTDAVIQGYHMLLNHNGFFLADVVGLGKTVVAAMIARRFVLANGAHTRILVIYPPSVEQNWKNTFKDFQLSARTHFVTNGSLDKVEQGIERYYKPEEYDLIIVDEAHGFRKDETQKYGALERICKKECAHRGNIINRRKKVILLSATPLNNYPEDLLNQLLLFEDRHHSTIDAVPNLAAFFTPKQKQYKQLMAERYTRDVTPEVDLLWQEIREQVIEQVTVRRTRTNILRNPDYKADLQKQGICFPTLAPPVSVHYEMDKATSHRFFHTLELLANTNNEHATEHIYYARYRAVEYLSTEARRRLRGNHSNAVQQSRTLAGIYRVHMVKRLESSFYAFKKSLHTLLASTQAMIQMFEQNKVVIAPEFNVKQLQADGKELDDIIEYILQRGYAESDFIFQASDFSPEFLDMLHNDEQVLQALNNDWAQEQSDPKFNQFLSVFNTRLFDPEHNPTGKLIVFSESVDTLDYLTDRLKLATGRHDILTVSAATRKQLEITITLNFDANAEQQQNNYNILLTSDALAEGINLHRSNVIVNYDSPWNATRLIQRIGRVNRIGSIAQQIHNYMFYPSRQGDAQIALYRNSLIKLQGFHSAFGEDAQVYSEEEILHTFSIFNPNVKDTTDERLALLAQVRKLYTDNRDYYERIKRLPFKSRTLRYSETQKDSSLVFIKSPLKTEYYHVQGTNARSIPFLEAARLLRAEPSEKGAPQKFGPAHFDHVRTAVNKYKTDYSNAGDTASINNFGQAAPNEKIASSLLRRLQRTLSSNAELVSQCRVLSDNLQRGIHAGLPAALAKLAKLYPDGSEAQITANADSIRQTIAQLAEQYSNRAPGSNTPTDEAPAIIISETFI